jgi:hypothetical protein
MRADTITRLLDPVFRGLESCAAAYRDAERQTMVWREELEACGQQQGMTVRDVHADLFRFLMCRRSSPPITEWLGNRLTNRVRAAEASLTPARSQVGHDSPGGLHHGDESARAERSPRA